MITIEGLTRGYDDGGRRVQVLDGVSLEIAAGQFLAVTGRSGSGKSTLLHVLGGLDSGFSGRVEVAGTRLTGLGDAELSRFRNQSVGIVFQSFHLVPGLSSLENVALPAAFGGAEPSPSRAKEALERVGLGEKLLRAPEQLSGGERQRVAIARALFHAPKVLLCDEPTGNLDTQTADEVIGLFKQLNADGLTIVAVTHEERLRSAASRVVTLRDGKVSEGAA